MENILFNTKFHDAILLWILQGVRQVLVKLGAKGSALFVEGEDPIHQPIIPASKVLDTTGAGDTFTAAFAVALVEGKSRRECLRFAGMQIYASFVITFWAVLSAFGHYDWLLWYCSCCSVALCSSEGGHSRHAQQESSFWASSVTLSVTFLFLLWVLCCFSIYMLTRSRYVSRKNFLLQLSAWDILWENASRLLAFIHLEP